MIDKLFRQVDNSPLVVFRMIFGALLVAEAWGAIATGWVEKAFITPDFTFPFIGFSFLEPLPGDGMYYYYGLMGLAGIFVAVGLYYRTSMLIYAIMWAGVYLMQKTNYNNHYYLLMLLNFMMVLVPAHRYASIDVKRKPEIKSLTCPYWCLFLFAFQISIVYFFAGIAKLNADWLIASPLDMWMEHKSSYWLIGPLLGHEYAPWFFAYGGIAFDLIVVQGLWFKNTRKFVFIIAVIFHIINSAVFQVGIFPYLGIAICIFFFDPEKVRAMFLKRKPSTINVRVQYPQNPGILIALSLWFMIQIALPLRHHLYTGDVAWTEEGHRLSWRMMLRVKTSSVNFEVIDNETNTRWSVNPHDYMTYKQAGAMASRPDMLWQFVQHIEKEWKEEGYNDISIYANSSVSLNRGPFKPLIDPEYDLTKAEWHPFSHSDWLLAN